MPTDVVKMFKGDRGYGFIKPDDGGPDVFLHASALEQAGNGSLPIRAKLSYDLVMDQRKGKTNSQNVKLFWWRSACASNINPTDDFNRSPILIGYPPDYPPFFPGAIFHLKIRECSAPKLREYIRLSDLSAKNHTSCVIETYCANGGLGLRAVGR
jgi:CspA family cold shock protein